MAESNLWDRTEFETELFGYIYQELTLQYESLVQKEVKCYLLKQTQGQWD